MEVRPAPNPDEKKPQLRRLLFFSKHCAASPRRTEPRILFIHLQFAAIAIGDDAAGGGGREMRRHHIAAGVA